MPGASRRIAWAPDSVGCGAGGGDACVGDEGARWLLVDLGGVLGVGMGAAEAAPIPTPSTPPRSTSSHRAPSSPTHASPPPAPQPTLSGAQAIRLLAPGISYRHWA